MKSLHHGFYVDVENNDASITGLKHVVCLYGVSSYGPLTGWRGVSPVHSYKRVDEQSMHGIPMASLWESLSDNSPVIAVRGDRARRTGKIQ